jgi:hypothetical protein
MGVHTGSRRGPAWSAIVDLTRDRDFRTLRGEHPGEFYLRLGFRIVGVLPDANGRGKPDIFVAKSLAA